MEKKKILILCASLKIGGAEKVAQSIALCAPDNAYDFHYLVFHEDEGEYEAALREKGCTIHRLPEPSDNYFLFLRGLWKLIRTHRFHAVHAHTMFNCGFVMLVARVLGVPVRISHSHSALINGKGIVKNIYEQVMRFLILTCSTHLVSCGVQAGNRLFGEKAFARQGILILNGVEVPRFLYSESRRSAIRKELNLQDCFILGHVGHLCDIKNQAFLLDLMPDILTHRPNAHLLLLGDGKDRDTLKNKTEQLGIAPHVTFTGNVANVEDYLSAMDVFVFPSRFEGMPLSILEVQANGLPCVLSDRVPTDVFLTDLIHPLSLEDPREVWINTILSLRRNNPVRYNNQLLSSDFSTGCAMEKIYGIYAER